MAASILSTADSQRALPQSACLKDVEGDHAAVIDMAHEHKGLPAAPVPAPSEHTVGLGHIRGRAACNMRQECRGPGRPVWCNSMVLGGLCNGANK